MEKSKSKRRIKTKKPKLSKTRVTSKKTTRVTVDFPIDDHKKLKAVAALEGTTLQEYIRNHVMEKVKYADIPDNKFKALMEKILKENDEILKRLADK